jgi:hypothetical protein
LSDALLHNVAARQPGLLAMAIERLGERRVEPNREG